MKLRLFAVHGSHPCVAVERALAIKRLPYHVVELPAVMSAAIMPVMFDRRTVPALRLDGEKISGSRAIMHRLDELVDAPALYPADPDARAAVEQADEWGDRVFQPIARELLWPGMVRSPAAGLSYVTHARIRLPAPVIRGAMPVLARASCKINRTSDELAAQRMRELPGHLDAIDTMIAAGTIGNVALPNAADLQIFSTLRLMQTIADVRPLVDGRPCGDVALALFQQYDGELPAGSIV